MLSPLHQRSDERLANAVAQIHRDRVRLQKLWTKMAKTDDTIRRAIEAVRESKKLLGAHW